MRVGSVCDVAWNQPSEASEFELGRGLPQELGRASIMEESSVQRTADGKQDAARRRRPSEACAQRRRATLAGGELRPDFGRCLRSAAPPFSDLPAPEAPTGAAPPILAAMTTRARRRRAGRLWAAGSAAGGGQRRAPRSPPRRRRASHAPAGFAAGRSGCASDLGPLLGGQPDARDAGPAVSRCVCGL